MENGNNGNSFHNGFGQGFGSWPPLGGLRLERPSLANRQAVERVPGGRQTGRQRVFRLPQCLACGAGEARQFAALAMRGLEAGQVFAYAGRFLGASEVADDLLAAAPEPQLPAARRAAPFDPHRALPLETLDVGGRQSQPQEARIQWPPGRRRAVGRAGDVLVVPFVQRRVHHRPPQVFFRMAARWRITLSISFARPFHCSNGSGGRGMPLFQRNSSHERRSEASTAGTMWWYSRASVARWMNKPRSSRSLACIARSTRGRTKS